MLLDIIVSSNSNETFTKEFAMVSEISLMYNLCNYFVRPCWVLSIKF